MSKGWTRRRLSRGRTTPLSVPQASEAIWFALTATVLAGVAPVLLLSSTQLADHASSAWRWSLVFSVLVGLRYAWLVAQGAGRMFEQIFWLFTYVFLGLAPLVQMRTSTYPKTTPNIDQALNGRSVLIVVLGALGFVVGTVLAGRRRGGDPDPVPVLSATPPAVSNHRLLLLTAGALLLDAYYTARLGVGTLLGTREGRSRAELALWPNTTVLQIVKAAATLPLVVSFAGLVKQRARRREAGLKGWNALPGVVLVVLLLSMNPLSSPRYVTGTALLAVVTALGATRTRTRARIFTLVLAAGLVLVFPYADLARSSNANNNAQDVGPSKALTSGDFDAFDQINNTVAYVEANGNTAGNQLAGAALFWVPRALWSNKPEDTGILLADFRGYSFHNLSAPMWSEMYINGGLGFVFVGLGALGFWIRRLDELALRRGGLMASGNVLLAILPFYLVIVLRGSLLQSMAGLSVLLGSGAMVTRRRAYRDRSGEYLRAGHTRVRRGKGARQGALEGSLPAAQGLGAAGALAP